MPQSPIKFSIDGTKDLEKALLELPKATSKNVGRRALKAAGEPIADDYRARAPRGETGDLVHSIAVSTKLSNRQKAQHRKVEGRDHVEMFVGAGPDPAAHNQEFGNINHAAQPALTPAWENNKYKAVGIIGRVLWEQIEKSAARLARKAAKLARGGK